MNNVMPVAYRGMVATPHYLASGVGSSILQQGGNAFDAAIAISAALSVVYPHMTGLGGDSFFLLFDAKQGELKGLNGTGRSGANMSPEWFTRQGFTMIPQRGVHSVVTVPGMVDSWWEVWSSHGRLSWSQLLEPAIQYAEQGVPVSRDLERWICKDQELLLAQVTLARTFMPQGLPMKMGDKLRQPELAATLRAVSLEGRDAFYKGTLMHRMVEAMNKDGGGLTESDFQAHHSNWVTPISTSYRGSTLVQMPPNSQGFSALQMMNMLELTELSEIPRSSADFYHLMSEVIKKAFRDRDAYLTDPDFADIPLETLLSKEHAKALYDEIQRSSPLGEVYMSKPMGQDTAYAAVIDEEGNAVSFIQSLYFDFGSAYVAGDTGVIMQNRGSFFSLNPSEVNVLAPDKRTFHTLMPGMVLREGKPYLLLGTQGGEGQPQTTISLLTGVLDYGCTIQEAINLPRWVYGRTWGENSDTFKIENRGLEMTLRELEHRGHSVETLLPWDPIVGQSQGIMIHKDGSYSGAADPRGDGLAIGW
ncbi:gamma-glutamyltransferase [Paenibacillus sp. FSL H7-0331]|uniref:gamma-glutamyltransferase n=1 Tax=Paenibacillus sp. FSL H7-0331 TaxID=1920421 RepID=UPI00096DB5F5|nr:gamma-glutamyltransferase [Paenibacillus sp. FSL H7-0331]OMF18258.1 gamma-glutamyltransferase [Paenibacillus sp. FSL H7-0331]